MKSVNMNSVNCILLVVVLILVIVCCMNKSNEEFINSSILDFENNITKDDCINFAKCVKTILRRVFKEYTTVIVRVKLLK